MKKQITGLALLLALIAPIAITFLTLHLQKHQIREEVKQTLLSETAPEDLTFLKFNSEAALAALDWEDEHEFEFKGEMFDVVSMEKKGETTLIWCRKDEKETSINRELDGLVADLCGNSPQRKQHKKQVIEFLFKLYCHKPMAFPTNMPDSQVFASFSMCAFPGIHTPPPVPPPQIGSSELA